MNLDLVELLIHQIQSHGRDRDGERRTFSAIIRRLALLSRTYTSSSRHAVRSLRSGRISSFSIGYQIAEQKLDPSYYDLLASEARLAFVANFSRRDVPALHNLPLLSRSLSPVGLDTALLSWSGSMFEYLMPSGDASPAGSLSGPNLLVGGLAQIACGKERRIPRGISESGCNWRSDLEFTFISTAISVFRGSD